MAKTYTARLAGDRTWSDGANGVRTSVSRKYMVVRNFAPSGASADEIDPTDVDGLPQPGSAYGLAHPNLRVSGYSWSDPGGNEKRKVTCTVSYSVSTSEAGEGNSPPNGQAIEELGWKSGSVSRDLVRDAGTGDPVLNTAGQPFDSVPQIDVPSPVFTKVVKTFLRQDWMSHYGKINAAQITVGGVVCAARTMRCVQLDEQRLWNDNFGYNYKYTIGLQLMTNSVKIAGAQQETDIGWDVAVVITGTYEKKNPNAKATPVTTTNPETGNPTFSSSPVLLDADGKAMLEPGSQPYAIRVQVYKTTTFPGEFYSETESKSNANQS